MKTKPKWIIFDVGQVIYDYKLFLTDASKHLQIEEIILREELNSINPDLIKGEMTFEQIWKTALKTRNLEHEYENIEKLWWDEERYLKDTKLLIKQLNIKGYSIALFSNNWPGMTNKILNKISDEKIIKYFFESSVEHLRKPDIRFYNLVEKKTKAKGKEIFFIDDKQINLDTAKRLDWQTFLYKVGPDKGKTSNDLIRKLLL